MEYEYEELVKDLYRQTFDYYPEDICLEDQQFLSELIYYNAMNIGEELTNKEYDSLDIKDKDFIIQVVMEWSFHKSVDFIHSKIDHKFFNEILKNFSIIVLKELKQCKRLKVDKQDMLGIVENLVQKTYNEELKKIFKRNLITKEEYYYAIRFSNIDDMAKQDNEKLSKAEESIDNVNVNKKTTNMDKLWSLLKDLRLLLSILGFIYTLNYLVCKYFKIGNEFEIFSNLILNAFGICFILTCLILIPGFIYYLCKNKFK